MISARVCRVIFGVVFCCLVLNPTPAGAHPDLLLQIEQLTQELSGDPANVDLLIRRGDLYRRHAAWAAAEEDFKQVRALQPDHSLIDWYEGRLQVESGHPGEGERLLSGFLQSNPDHPGAYRTRARSYLQLAKPLSAAQDFQESINYSERPSPGIYRSLILSLVAGGPQQLSAATRTVLLALERFPGEVALLGLAVELSLAQSNTRQALAYVARLPTALTRLPQWKFRKAILACIDGDRVLAVQEFSAILAEHEETSAHNTGAWSLPHDLLRELDSDPQPEKCRNAAWQILTRQQP